MKTDSQFNLETACHRLQLGEDGIFYANGGEVISYPEEGNEACFQIEDHSFWFRHRNDCIRELVRNFPPRGTGPIFDVGGGNGFVAKGLMDAGWDVVLVKPVRSSLIRKGMTFSPAHGDIAFTVPLFDPFMRRAMLS